MKSALASDAAFAAPRIDARELASSLAERGYAIVRKAVGPARAHALRAEFARDERFRSTIEMARHGFGSGRYRYYAAPLPSDLQRLRADFYAALAPLANAWARELGGGDEPFEDELADFLARCARRGQTKCTVLQLRYERGDYNALHRDVYGAVAFPLQATILLSEPRTEFEGGEFVLVEQRPRKQSVATVVPLELGDAVVFANDARPVAAASGRRSRVRTRHGVSLVTRGERYALGLIFHDAP